MFDIDHIISDRTTFQIIVEEFIQFYENKTLKKPVIHYKDYSLWQKRYFKSEEFAQKEKYWLDILKIRFPKCCCQPITNEKH